MGRNIIHNDDGSLVNIPLRFTSEQKVVDRKRALMNLFSHHHSRGTIHIQALLLAACQHSIRI